MPVVAVGMHPIDIAPFAAASIAIVVLGACGGGLDQPQRFAHDASIRGGAASVFDAGAATALPGQEMQPSTARPAPDSSDGAVAIDAGADAGSVHDAGPALPHCITHLFSTRCAAAGCHGAGSSQLDLVSAGVRARLLDRPSLPSSACAGRVYIATDGAPSLLLEKLDDSPPCGERMPPSAVLHKRETDCLVQWVDSLGGSDSDAGGP